MKKINKEIIALGLIILLAAFLRLYHISSYMQFLGDEGRDVLIARDILHGKFTLLGPRSSAGDFYMGPFYYYLIAPFLLFSFYNPVGPAVMVALFGISTVILLYLLGKKFFNSLAGLFAASLYAVSPLVLTYSHSSWNPNVLPFFSLLLLYSVYYAVTSVKSWKFFSLIGILLGICFQLHYLSLILAVIIFVYLFLESNWGKFKSSTSSLIAKYVSILSGAVVSLSPFILFEFRHDFLNTRGILKFAFGETVVQVNSIHTNFFHTVFEVFFRIFSRLIFNFPSSLALKHYPGFELIIWGGSSVVLALLSLWALYLRRNKPLTMLLSLWLFFGCFLFGFYKKEIYDYLFTFIFPLPFLLFGNLFSFPFSSFTKPVAHKKGKLTAKNPVGNLFFKILSISVFLLLIVINLLGNPFRIEPNNQRDQAKKIVDFVISKTGNKPFNFAVLSSGNGDYAYQYYFQILGHKPVDIENLEKDPMRKTVTHQLFVVCEDINCKPLGNSLWQVAGFGRAEITDVWNVSVLKVYRLVPYRK